MNKTLSKEIMKRSHLGNKYLLKRIVKVTQNKEIMRITIKKDRNELLFELKRKKLDDRKFWKNMKQMLSNKLKVRVEKQHFSVVKNHII